MLARRQRRSVRVDVEYLNEIAATRRVVLDDVFCKDYLHCVGNDKGKIRGVWPPAFKLHDGKTLLLVSMATHSRGDFRAATENGIFCVLRTSDHTFKCAVWDEATPQADGESGFG